MISSEFFDVLGPAFFIGVLIALTHAPLGVEVLKRGIIFIDLAVAQIAGLGLIFAKIILHDPNSWLIQSITLLFAIVAAYFFHYTEKKYPEQQEAIIGSSFILAASLAILLLADHPHGGDNIKHLLSGQMLFVTWAEILKHTPVYFIIILLWFIFPKVRKGIYFYLIFAVVITSSVQLVGVYVVFASLILPALAVLPYEKRKNRLAWLCGFLSVILGVLLSFLYDMPSGPVVVISYMFVTFASFVYRKLKFI